MPYTVAEFAQKIREKYNAYQDVDDQALLVDKMIEKYPVYADQISLSKKKKQKKQNWLQVLKRKLWNLLPKFKMEVLRRHQF